MKTKNNIVPLGDRILVKPMSPEDTKKTKSGIIIPDTVSKERPEQGKVIAVGAGRINDDGKVIPIRVKVGDMVLFSKYGPDEIKVGGEEYVILKEENILAIIK
ncbi:MAG: co-chaperone GroES [Candidatus Paceibacterota bacterium]|jgi:chaperonin GroES